MYEQLEYLNLPIIWGSAFDLSRIDLSFSNVKIVKVGDKDFYDFLSNYFHREFIEHAGFLTNFMYSKGNIFDVLHKEKYAFIPTILDSDHKDFTENWKKILALLQLVFPSDLQLERVLYIDKNSKANGANFGTYLIQPYFSYEASENGISSFAFGKIIYPNMVILDDLNIFMKLGYNHFSLHEFSIDNYIHSITTSPFFQYVALCMTIESTIDSDTEIKYRFSRNTAIMCGNLPEECTSIYNFLREAYNLRSKIVHGSKLDLVSVSLNLTTLRCIVSTLLVNLLVNGISNKQYNAKIHSCGFGQRDSICPMPFIDIMPNKEMAGALMSPTLIFKKP